MAVTDKWPVSRNQEISRENQLDVEAEARLYDMWRFFWHPVMQSSELSDTEPASAVLLEQQLVVARLDGEVRVFNDLCAHRGTALSLGKVIDDGAHLRCPYHGWQYNGDGHCVIAPQRPDLAGRVRARIKKYQAVERYGLVWVCLEDEPRFPIPEYPWFDAPGFNPPVFMPVSDWKCAAPRRVENFTDYGHFAFVHDGWLGDINHPEIPKHEVTRDAHLLRNKQLDPHLEPGGISKWGEVEPQQDGQFVVEQRWSVSMPLSVSLDMNCGTSEIHHFFHATPLGPKMTRNFTISTRNFADPATDYDDLIGFAMEVYSQDLPVVESQRPEELPEDLSLEMHLAGVDTFSLEYRRWLLELADELCPTKKD